MNIAGPDPKRLNLAISTIRLLAVDMVEKASSGHPGMPMEMAEISFVLWSKFLKFNPKDPSWINRDRFILSAGHGSAHLYSLLHLFGYGLSLDELKKFRQIGSLTPGHPEFNHTPGVETTTGPLGQGIANAVGMALAEEHISSQLNSFGKKIINHKTYFIASDGDLMEGISHEAASIAGHLGLSKLIGFYSDNKITIEGKTDLAYSEDVGKRFESYNWHTTHIDAYNLDEIQDAIETAIKTDDKPSLIIAATHIGKGSPNKQDTASAHGEPLGKEEARLTKEALGWPKDKSFYIPNEAQEIFQTRINELKPAYDQWKNEWKELITSNKEFAQAFNSLLKKEVPAGLEGDLIKTINSDPIATRSASGNMIQVIGEKVPSLIGGSADLSPSTKTHIKNSTSITKKDYSGRNLHFGIREHAMTATLNGMAAYGGLIPFGSTFLVFSDYMRPSIRLAALMKLQAIYVFTHDSIFVGEDGPTHQPIEHLAALRIIPNLRVIRPSDATETAAAWTAALNHKTGPTALVLTRQNLPVIDRKIYSSQNQLKFGGYILKDCDPAPELIIIATGSEVALALDVAKELELKSIPVRVVSMPCMELFDLQSEEYKKKIIPSNCQKIVTIEAGATLPWYKYSGADGLIIGIDSFGTSAPYKELANHFGFNKQSVLEKINKKWPLF